ncbi:hypothetical protein BKA67DRAFT_530309 [Truncatella angustata]|uniref:RING-type domain-containing protein n=1 Tax=Truncatella angustata TaxID=152316 RepID=A0A9P8UXK0_9PEZI|nr:uncharacterized protein BKA67DRAFT_530309 [Truncatella angustata]KAH6660192.1 hypothetical protein BKA67DRAFT_530309 [Truncatella angustata]
MPPAHGLQTNSLPVPPFVTGNVAGDYYGAQGSPHGHAHSTPRFPQRPTIPSIDRSGGVGPSHYSPNPLGNASTNSGPSEHVSRSSRLPALTHVSTDRAVTSPSRDLASPLRNGSNVGRSRTPEISSTAARSSSVTMPPMPQRPTESFTNSQRTVVGQTHNRYYVSALNSDSPSDEDSDPNETEMMTARMLDAITATGESGLRAAQLMRGVNPGRKVASRKAIADLESVELSDLPESERACIICYNDFGTETPEGINEAPLRLPKCQHVFGDHCIKKWFAESDSCPYCRDKLPSEPQHRADPESFVHVMRQSQMQVLRHASRNGWARDNHGEARWGTSEASSASTYRRPDALPSVRSWQQSERRSPPGDVGENRRRTRPRHGSLRASPPSARSNLFMAPGISGHPNGQYHTNGGRLYPSGHNHRHSMGALGSPVPAPAGFENTMAPYLGQVPMYHAHEPRLPFPNPLMTSETGIQPRWPPARPDFYPPASHTIGGPEIRMADPEERGSDYSAQ